MIGRAEAKTMFSCSLCADYKPTLKRNNVEQHIWQHHPQQHGGNSYLHKYRAGEHKLMVARFVVEEHEPASENSTNSMWPSVQQYQPLAARRHSAFHEFNGTANSNVSNAAAALANRPSIGTRNGVKGVHKRLRTSQSTNNNSTRFEQPGNQTSQQPSMQRRWSVPNGRLPPYSPSSPTVSTAQSIAEFKYPISSVEGTIDERRGMFSSNFSGCSPVMNSMCLTDPMPQISPRLETYTAKRYESYPQQQLSPNVWNSDMTSVYHSVDPHASTNVFKFEGSPSSVASTCEYSPRIPGSHCQYTHEALSRQEAPANGHWNSGALKANVILSPELHSATPQMTENNHYTWHDSPSQLQNAVHSPDMKAISHFTNNHSGRVHSSRMLNALFEVLCEKAEQEHTPKSQDSLTSLRFIRTSSKNATNNFAYNPTYHSSPIPVESKQQQNMWRPF